VSGSSTCLCAALTLVGGLAVWIPSGYACPEATAALSYTVHGCRAPTAFCPAGSAVSMPTSSGHYSLTNALGLYASQAMCEAGR
jgi:hypothetical protein